MKKILFITIFVIFAVKEAGAAGRYISLAPSTTEILFALGLEDEIIGVSAYCNYPENARRKEKAGTFSQPNLEKILSLKPDYIFSTGLEQAEAVIELKRLKLPIYVADPANVRELLNSIMDIGKLTGKIQEAEKLTAEMRDQIREINTRAKLIPENKRPKVFIEIWHNPLATAGKGSFIDDLITLAGGINIAYDTKRPYSNFSQETVIIRNPDCVILAYMDKEAPRKLLGKRFGWQEISAVKNNRVFNDIDPDLLLRPGPRAVLGLKEIYKRIHRQ